MRLKPYPEYKDSGIEWLGQVPKEWTVTKIKYVASFTTGRTPPTGDSESFEGDNLWANISDLGPKVLYDTAKRVSDEAIKRSNITASPKGSLLFSFKLSIGQVGFAGFNLYTNEAIATFLPANEARLDYLYYASPVYIVENTSFNIYGAKLLNQELINSAPIALPSQEGQRKIATFLDRETGKLDILIAKQKHLIDLLQEKRQAIISHAVTKGLNPDVKMKETSVKWLGEVPDQWSVKKIKHTSYLKGRVGWKGLTSDEYLESGYAYLVTGTDFKSKYINWDNCHHVDEFRYEDDPYIKLKDGDLLITKDGTIGKLALVENLKGYACLNSGIFLVRPIHSYITSYLYWVLSSNSFSEFYKMTSVGSTIQHLYQNVFENFFFPIPTIDEQQEIVAYIEKATKEIDTLIEKAKRSIELAKEHRTALISAAVTGKIDVREAA